MKKEDMDDSGTSGRSGRVRKKSAKLLEMEEFEQVEKTQTGVKKGKQIKVGSPISVEQQSPAVSEKMLIKKVKVLKAPSAALPVSSPAVPAAIPAKVKVLKIGGSKPETGFTPKPKEAGLLAQPHIPASSNKTKAGPSLTPTEMLALVIKQEVATLEQSDQSPKTQTLKTDPDGSDNNKSVIKYLLNSPTAGSLKTTPSSTEVSQNSASLPKETSEASARKVLKKSFKLIDGTNIVKKSKPKKVKVELLSSSLTSDSYSLDKIGTGLKMKIFSSSDPSAAQVSIKTEPEPELPVKAKKHKFHQELEEQPDCYGEVVEVKTEEPEATPVKKHKKASKKKEKLIQEAISAAQHNPSLLATTLPTATLSSLSSLPTPDPKPAVKKRKSTSPLCTSYSASSGDDLHENGKSDSSCEEDGEEEAHLVIAETEIKKKKKKKPHNKKKGFGHKDLPGALTQKVLKTNKEEKISKRSPTAYMLFCNTHRPEIVSENPGIEFAGISRKLGELWQTLSNKQKLQWRRKAQRRRKKGSNLISTGKGSKEAKPGPSPLTPATQVSQVSQVSPAIKQLTLMMHKAQQSSPEDTPQSPTKNFSIEPIDVAAHLKLLGESLSIIGMRLQEHKGMIAVQGSLSVLLDSLLCACGPLLCLTQQVPGMDGCSTLVHGQTLDSVAYIMPGL